MSRKYLFFFSFFLSLLCSLLSDSSIVFPGKWIVPLIILHRYCSQCASFTFRTRRVSRRMDVFKRETSSETSSRCFERQTLDRWRDKLNISNKLKLPLPFPSPHPAFPLPLNRYLIFPPPDLITGRDTEKVVTT